MVSLPDTPRSLSSEIFKSGDTEENREEPLEILNAEEQTERYDESRTVERGPFITSAAVPLLFSKAETGSEEPVEFYEDDYTEGEESHLSKRAQTWPQEVHEFSYCLAWKKCIVFDLDNTLHYFDASCYEAAHSVLEYISTVFPIELSRLKEKYQEIRLQKDWFREIQRISCNYDFEGRFNKLLHHFGIFTAELFNRVLDLYKKHQLQNLTLKPGVYKLLRALSAKGKILVTLSTRMPIEQEQAIRKLKIEKFIRTCYTWFDISTSQANRLVDIKQELGLQFSDLLYFGGHCHNYCDNEIGEDNIGDVNEARSLGFQAVCIHDPIGAMENDDPFIVWDKLPLMYKHSRLVKTLENSWQYLGNPAGSRPAKLIRFQNWDHVKFLFLRALWLENILPSLSTTTLSL